jgi:transcription initiation factor TFIIB
VRADNGIQGHTCIECGLVLKEETLDRGPEWRAFTPAERDEKSRVGAPATNLLHDKGLSTKISWQNKDAYGNQLPGRKRKRLQRLRKWDERFRAKDNQERNLKQGLGEISRMASALGLSQQVRETAAVLYRRAVDDELLPGRSIEGMASAALFAAARSHTVPCHLSEFANVSRVEKLRIQRAYRYLVRVLSLEIQPEDPMEYLPQFASRLGASDEAAHVARELLDAAIEACIHSGKSPKGMAAAAMYAATQLTNEKLTQEAVGDAANVSPVTIRTRYQEILEVYQNTQ